MLNAHLFELLATHQVKTVRAFQKKQQSTEKWQPLEDISFDINGNMLERISYDEGGQVYQKLEQQFNAKNQLIESAMFMGSGDWQKTYYEFDENGKTLGETTRFSSDTLVKKRVQRNAFYEEIIQTDEEDIVERREYRSYDDKGQLIKETIYEGQSEIIREATYIYDIYGRKIESFTFDREDLYRFHHYHEYDKENREIRRLVHFEHGELFREESWQYNEQGQLILHRHNDQTTQYLYNDEAQLIKLNVHNPDGSLQSMTNTTYNDVGLLLEETHYDMGQAYEIEPQVVGRSLSTHINIRYTYEFF